MWFLYLIGYPWTFFELLLIISNFTPTQHWNCTRLQIRRNYSKLVNWRIPILVRNTNMQKKTYEVKCIWCISDKTLTMGDLKKHDVVGYAFGALVATGGLMGFVKKRWTTLLLTLTSFLLLSIYWKRTWSLALSRSVPSLLAGVTFGGLAAFGAYDVRKAYLEVMPFASVTLRPYTWWECCYLTSFVDNCYCQASENPETPYVGAAVAGLLGTAMGARYIIWEWVLWKLFGQFLALRRALKSKSFMPAGAVSILSIAMLTKYRYNINIKTYEGYERYLS